MIFFFMQKTAEEMRLSIWSSDVCSSDLVDGDVVHAGLDAGDPRAVQHQPVGGRQRHLEEDEEVEQVTSEERAVQPDQQELEQRVKIHAGHRKRVLTGRSG